MVTAAELKNQATDPDVAVVSLLKRALILATSLQDKEFISWIGKEFNGYEKSDIAAHRILNGQYIALTDAGPLPIPFQGSDMNQRFITMPITEIQELLANSPKRSHFAVKIQIDPASLEQLRLEPGESIAFRVTRGTLVRLIEAIKTRILEWSLKL